MPGFLPAIIDWPQARTWPAPTLVVAHGAGDWPEPHCELWRRLLGARGVIVCLRGRALRKGSDAHGYYFPDHLALERETLAALAALRERYAGFADSERIVYAGYSQGATMGALMLMNHGELAPTLLLVEGGSGDWTSARARRFALSGGRRVALLCGTPGCQRRALQSVERLKAVELDASLRYRAGAGHTYVGAISADMVAAFDELTRDDSRWAQ